MPRTKQFNEAEVLHKAMELFWEKGFHATSMQDLVNHLGINRASIYDTYGGKNELFDKAFQNYRTISLASLKSIFDSESDVKKGFRKLFQMVIDDVKTQGCQKGCFVVNTITELVPGDTVLLEKLKQNAANTEGLFEQYIQRGIDDGHIDASKNPKAIAFTLFTLFSGLRVTSKVEQNSKKLNEMVEVGLSILD
ncbi:TetR/AcrR family transcriptional regulator [Maribacter algarum]|uniref:TetR/AcrR family transcriptional regulator n=2 Tax=Maribacter algarum (ex Zhang et al. 2020) TaxID=2578118 RepID=A0A5S3PX86_9FLAO|nr:TetR/AcrR family transcriptional regulator [Maribacter algarum]